MTKNGFMTIFMKRLKECGVADVDDIVMEYEQHFSFKLRDGYSEAEIAKKLGDPSMLARLRQVPQKLHRPGFRKSRAAAPCRSCTADAGTAPEASPSGDGFIADYIVCAFAAGAVEWWHV